MRFQIVGVRFQIVGVNKMEYVYLVKQTQRSEGYLNTTIYVCSTEKRAMEYAKKLNEEYGNGRTHYYDVEKMKVDEDLAYL